MIHRSFRTSFFHFSILNLTRPVTPAVTSSKQPVFFTQGFHRAFSNLCRDPDDQMAKNRNKNTPKGIKRKGPKRTSLDGGSRSQAGQERAMGHRGDYYTSDQARERLESAVWSQTSSQQQQSPYQSQGQQQFYQPPNWPPQQSPAPREREYAPGVEPRTPSAENVLYTPPLHWETSAWPPPHHQPAPQPTGGFQHWGQAVSTAGGQNPLVTSSVGGGNSPFYLDLGGSGSQSQRGYSTVSDPPPDNQGEEDNSNPNFHSHSDTPQHPSPTVPKMGKWKHPKKGGRFSLQNSQTHLRINENRDEISRPSAASGGVPDPTPSYLLRASFLPRTVPEPRPMLVVIDLNGTMLFRPSRRQASVFVARPHAKEFLTYCIDTFHVVIWSSARPENVEAMCRKLLTKAQLDKVVARWGRDRFGLTAEDYNKRTQCYKRLTKLWEDPKIAAAHPHGEPWNQGNTVLIDDSTEKARSEPCNAVTLPEFMGDLHEQPPVLPVVHDYLNILAMQADISTFIRQNPFKLDGDYRELPIVKGPEEFEGPPTGADSADGTIAKEIEGSAPSPNAS